MRLDLALISLHPELSRRRARDVIEKGQVTLGGETVLEPGRPVPAGAAVRWDPNRKARPRARLSLPLLFADEALVVVDKPAGLLVVPSGPGATGEDTVMARVRDYAGRLRPGRPYAGAVHRLDRDTSGALAVALRPDAREGLRRLFREHRVERRYLALVAGTPRSDEGAVDRPVHVAYRAGRRRLAGDDEPSLPALTRWRVRRRFQGAALVELELATGRQHQIRLHLAHLGLPLLGEPVYGREDRRGARVRAPRQMLHAEVLGFQHPLTGETVRVKSPLPEDFKRVLAALERRELRRR